MPGGKGLRLPALAAQLYCGQLMVIVAETNLLLSVTEVAVTVTVLPGGIAEGAW